MDHKAFRVGLPLVARFRFWTMMMIMLLNTALVPGVSQRSANSPLNHPQPFLYAYNPDSLLNCRCCPLWRRNSHPSSR